MSRIEGIFARLRSEGRAAIMPFVTGGHPSLDATRDVLPALERAGASIVEIGIPFSDPIADGPVIAASMHDAIAHGVTPLRVFDAIRAVRPRVSIGLVAMVSVSIVNRMGTERFTRDAKAAGFDGLIVPDADTEAGRAGPAGALAKVAADAGVSCTFLIAPTTSEHRIASIASICTGFVYVLARVGITGEQDAAPASGIAARVAMVRKHTNLPIAVGFGISKPAHVALVTESADAAIVGSALVRRMSDASDPAAEAERFIRDLANGLGGGTPAASPSR